mmetsp:Transcript_53650/g.116977  ORF Transcript_53650/g.116977 Transcript_53650/m.116977 type:complete len:597 (+) Transcript_53650:202-1992(+)
MKTDASKREPLADARVNGVFHSGEVAVQKRVGVYEETQEWAPAVIRNVMPDQHRQFFTEQPFFIMSTLSGPEGLQPWPSLVAYDSAESPDEETLILRGVRVPAADKLLESIASVEAGNIVQFGGLGIQFHTRRRNRLNGIISKVERSPDGGISMHLKTVHSFGNCPKYIQARRIVPLQQSCLDEDAEMDEKLGETFKEMDECVLSLLRRADTFFIASGNANIGADVSHRGGNPGFLRAVDSSTLMWPDYKGNEMYQTLGNLVVNARTALFVPDFESRDVAVIVGTAEILFDRRYMPLARRTVQLKVEQVVYMRCAMPFAWQFDSFSPYNPPTGDCGSAAVAQSGDLPLQLLKKEVETSDVQTFTFRAPRPVDFSAGQYATLRFQLGDETLVRSWTISSGVSAGDPPSAQFQLTVKRRDGGRVTPWMLDQLSPTADTTALISLAAVEGDFVVGDAQRDASRFLFIAGGIGITPLMSLLRTLRSQPLRRRLQLPPIVLLYTARTHKELVFDAELRTMSERLPQFEYVPLLTREGEQRRIDAAVLRDAVGADVLADFAVRSRVQVYMCGPAQLQRMVADTLVQGLGLPESNLHADSFEF